MTKINTIILPAGDSELINLTGDYLLGTVELELEFDSEEMTEELVVPEIEEEAERCVEILGYPIGISDDEYRILRYDDDVCVDDRVKMICRTTERVDCSDIMLVYELPPSEYLYILAELQLYIDFESSLKEDK